LPPDISFFGTDYVLSKYGKKVKKVRGSRNGKMRWYKRIHEYLGFGEGKLYDEKGIYLDHEIAHGRSPNRGRINTKRNYTILYDSYEKNPKDPHYILYLARELHAHGRLEEAKQVIYNTDPKILDNEFYKLMFPTYNNLMKYAKSVTLLEV
jgi:hypothetical protein